MVESISIKNPPEFREHVVNGSDLLRKVLRTSGARVLEDELAIGQADEAFNSAGELNDPDQVRRLTALIHKLLDGAQTSAAPVVESRAGAERRVA